MPTRKALKTPKVTIENCTNFYLQTWRPRDYRSRPHSITKLKELEVIYYQDKEPVPHIPPGKEERDGGKSKYGKDSHPSQKKDLH